MAKPLSPHEAFDLITLHLRPLVPLLLAMSDDADYRQEYLTEIVGEGVVGRGRLTMEGTFLAFKLARRTKEAWREIYHAQYHTSHIPEVDPWLDDAREVFMLSALVFESIDEEVLTREHEISAAEAMTALHRIADRLLVRMDETVTTEWEALQGLHLDRYPAKEAVS